MPMPMDSARAVFERQWAKSARTAGKMLGIPWQYVLGQWGMETAWGKEPPYIMGKNNPGNVGNLGGHFVNYPSQQAFVKSYVASMKNDFPYFRHPLKHGTPTIGQVFNGPQKYDPGTTTYGVNVAGGVTALGNTSGLPKGYLNMSGDTGVNNPPGGWTTIEQWNAAHNPNHIPVTGTPIERAIISIHNMETTPMSVTHPIQAVEKMATMAGFFIVIFILLALGLYLLFSSSSVTPDIPLPMSP